ncbi:GNAT family N-acetyltransferase [Leucobacter albus]|uniref:GNAT family N-acetyltransferase n=1 Tax=Leucobacter albus TaxID=272210 RepID=A0ABW3TMC7_9MICO
MILQTPRLTLRELTSADLPALREILQDDETMTAYEGAFDDAMVEAWFARMRERYATDGFGLWAVTLRDTDTDAHTDTDTHTNTDTDTHTNTDTDTAIGGIAAGDTMIGQCGLTRQHILGEDVIEVGYLFNRAHWHLGYAAEAAAACRDYAFNTLGVDRVYAQIRDTNLASMNVAIRLGMTVRGRFSKHYRGVEMPHLAFAVDRQ